MQSGVPTKSRSFGRLSVAALPTVDAGVEAVIAVFGTAWTRLNRSHQGCPADR
jgi:hypothetical protein